METAWGVNFVGRRTVAGSSETLSFELNIILLNVLMVF